MKILLAPDKFKGSLTARQVCACISSALSQSGKPFEIQSVPLADGGEGSLEILMEQPGSTLKKVLVRDPLFRVLESRYGISSTGTEAFVEMASASGLQHLGPAERNPMLTTSYGTGELIRDALDHGVRRIILTVGGTATNDAGMGIAEALGVKFFDRDEKRLEPIGKNLKHVQFVDDSFVHPRLKTTEFHILCDVDNPLHGVRGAAFVFAPQKGATPLMVVDLDEGLKNYEGVLVNTFGKKVNVPGSGAGGGVAATLLALAGSGIYSGIDFLMEFNQLEQKVQWADWIITGEGKLDEQTLSGKVVQGVCAIAHRYQKPVLIVAGKNELSDLRCQELKSRAVITLVDKHLSETESMVHADTLLKHRVLEKIIPLLLSHLPG